MKRKVIQIADSTQLISLPRKWAQKYGVKKGDEIEVEEMGSRIIISTDRGTLTDELTVDVSGLTPLLVDRFIARSYQKGYDKIKIRFDDPKLMLGVQDKIPELMGFEIMEKSKNSCDIQILSSKLEIDFDSALRRAFLTILDIANATLLDFKNGDKEALKTLEHKDLEVNKFCYFCLRAINKGRHEGFGTYALHYLIESLEDLGDEYKELTKILVKMQTNKKNDFCDLLRDINNVAKLCYEFFYKPEKQKAVQILSMYKDAEKRIENLLKTDHTMVEIKALIRMWHIMEILYKFPTIRLDTLKELTKTN